MKKLGLIILKVPISQTRTAEDEAVKILKEKQVSFNIVPTRFRGLVLLEVEKPREVANLLREFETYYIYKIFPAEKIVETNYDIVKREAIELSKLLIKPEETFACRVERRGAFGSRTTPEIERDIGGEINDIIGCKCNLKDPDKLVQIEVLDGDSAICILNRAERARK